ncbi:hypothetical protein CHS0354_008291 [Potamilus streckersoni]|uniref:Uncharacterized protein n=1 Tax=Potamilus streckersoni TaxID=2493646 RepID=A0AAE0RQS7_9BIVA|nr:hypothetical protein CHS0354_008291 [Potamilus streckersoni]
MNDIMSEKENDTDILTVKQSCKLPQVPQFEETDDEREEKLFDEFHNSIIDDFKTTPQDELIHVAKFSYWRLYDSLFDEPLYHSKKEFAVNNYNM